MKNKLIKNILITLVIMLFIICIISKPSLAIRPGALTGEQPTGVEEFSDQKFIKDLSVIIRNIGIFIAVGAMMVIGIKYMTGSIEEKASYKKSMFPYLVGCILLFGAATIEPMIVENFSDLSDTEKIGNTILGFIKVIGTFVSIAVLMIIGIKYMLGSIEERATYKKSLLPYIVGSILLFAAVNITAGIYDAVALDGQWSLDKAIFDADAFIQEVRNGEVGEINKQIEEKTNYLQSEIKKAEEEGQEDKKGYYEQYLRRIESSIGDIYF